MPRSLRILLGEDDNATALGLEAELKDLGHSVLGIATDGATAVAMARSLNPDLVLLDVRMPHMSGLDAAAAIHAERAVPIIVVSGFSDAEMLTKAEGAPVFHFLVKPVARAQLEAALSVATARHSEWQRERTERESLHRRLEDRKTIERAKGLLMERHSITESAAYRMLQRTSQSRNISMAELSRSLLEADALMRGGAASAQRASDDQSGEIPLARTRRGS